jgi:diguanylate cyclase (GGDEF)-like protein/PAS domain S-box-containing protein
MKKSVKGDLWRTASTRINICVSILAIVLLAGYTIFFVHPSFTETVTESTEQESLRVGRHLAKMFFTGRGEITRQSIPADFEDHAVGLKEAFTFFKLKVFSPSGEVVFSTDEEDIGIRNTESYFREVIARGKTYAKVVEKGKPSLENRTMKAHVVETYVPIMDGGTFLGAFELYYDISTRKQQMHALTMRTTLTVLVLAGVLMAIVIASSLRTRKATKERNKAMEELRSSEEKFSKLFHHSNDGIILHDLEGTIVAANGKAVELFGYPETELLALTVTDLHPKEDLRASAEALENIARDMFVRFEIRFRKKDGEIFSAEVSASLFSIGGRRVIQGIVRDMTERKRLEERLEYQAHHDDLTGLANRTLLTAALREAARSASGVEPGCAVLFLDLDRFKVVNDSLGHSAGDKLLVSISRRLKRCLRPGDFIARAGGDEFAILVKDCKADVQVTVIAERIQETLERPFTVEGQEVFISASMGIALSSGAYESPEQLLRDADIAMYRAKEKGRACYAFFEASMHRDVTQRLAMEGDLRRALERREFRLHYQPIMSLETGRIMGFEALLRWAHPEQGLISPMEFIPLAEETGLIIPIGRWVLEEACSQMSRWQKRFHQEPPLSVSVNISSKQFHEDLIREIEAILTDTRLEAQHLILEITESAIMEKGETATFILAKLRKMGVSLHIDDFGTGYSSLSYLHHFPIDVIKIDRSFTNMVGADRQKEEIVQAIITLAASLKMDVIAEGVETMEQAKSLIAMRCTHAQGFLFSKPLESESAEALLADDPERIASSLPLPGGVAGADGERD